MPFELICFPSEVSVPLKSMTPAIPDDGLTNPSSRTQVEMLHVDRGIHRSERRVSLVNRASLSFHFHRAIAGILGGKLERKLCRIGKIARAEIYVLIDKGLGL